MENNENKNEPIININAGSDNKKKKEKEPEVIIDIEYLTKDIKLLNKTHYIDSKGYIKEKNLYKLKKFTFRFFATISFGAIFFYGVVIPYFEYENNRELRKFAYEKTSKIFTTRFGDKKDILIEDMKKEIKTIKIVDENEVINQKEEVKVQNKTVIKEKLIEDMKKEIIENVKTPDNSINKTIQKEKVIDESKDFNKNDNVVNEQPIDDKMLVDENGQEFKIPPQESNENEELLPSREELLKDRE